MDVAIIGTGLIGGSLALDLRSSGFAHRLIGVDRNPEHAEMARRLGLVDEMLPLEAAVAAPLIVVAVPVDEAVRLLPTLLDRIGPGQTVTDVCSTKRSLLQAVATHPRRDRFVAGHPMAGTEYSGPSAARPGLFSGRIGILCDVGFSAPDAVRMVEAMYTAVGMVLVYMDAERHDLHTAYVSHLSHVVSYALALTVLDKERDERQIFNLAGGGFASTARLAKSSPTMWTPIFRHNTDYLLAAVEAFQERLAEFRAALERGDSAALDALISRANDIRRILDRPTGA
jgi:prephenate dehydrogenase